MERKHICAFLWRLVLDVVFPVPIRLETLSKLSATTLLTTAKHASNDTVLSKANTEAVFAYRDPLIRDAIRAFKYEGIRQLGRVFAETLYDTLHEDVSYDLLLSTSGSPLLVVPIPLSRERYLERGFNQSEIVAEHFVQLFESKKILLASHVLVRNRNTERQALRPGRAEREENIRGCFSTPFPEQIAGKHIILIDDVITTGATMREGRQALLDAGAVHVRCIAIAH